MPKGRKGHTAIVAETFLGAGGLSFGVVIAHVRLHRHVGFFDLTPLAASVTLGVELVVVDVAGGGDTVDLPPIAQGAVALVDAVAHTGGIHHHAILPLVTTHVRLFRLILHLTPLTQIGKGGIAIVAVVPPAVGEQEVIHTVGFVTALVVRLTLRPVQVTHRLAGAPFPTIQVALFNQTKIDTAIAARQGVPI